MSCARWRTYSRSAWTESSRITPRSFGRSGRRGSKPAVSDSRPDDRQRVAVERKVAPGEFEDIDRADLLNFFLIPLRIIAAETEQLVVGQIGGFGRGSLPVDQ